MEDISFKLLVYESQILQPLVQYYKAITFHVQCLDRVPAFAAEQKQQVAERIQVKLLLGKRCQVVYSTAQVSVYTRLTPVKPLSMTSKFVRPTEPVCVAH